jgi:hypothetical protein
MKILFTGDSWTYGSELGGKNGIENRLKNRFSKLVCNHFKADETNIAAPGQSNYAIINNAISEIDNNLYNFCVIQLTYFGRIVLPINNRLETFTYWKRNTDIISIVIRKLFTTNTLGDSIYFKYYYPNIVLFNQYCVSKNVVPIFIFTKTRDIDNFKKELKHDIDFVGVSLDKICLDNGVLFGPKLHPLEDGHRVISDMIIKEIEKRL